MKKILLTTIGLLITLLVSSALAGSITITRSGASVDEFLDGDDKHSLANSIYVNDHGILLGDGFGKATPVYRILLPPPISGSSQITSIIVTIEGNDSWLSNPYVHIGTPAQISESIGDGLHIYEFPENDAIDLLNPVEDGLEHTLGYTLDVKIVVGGLTDQYDLKEIQVTFVYSDVSTDTLKRYQEAYTAYRTLKGYESGLVNSLWDQKTFIERELYYPAVQKALAFADNLSNLSGSLYDSLKTTINCIDDFKELVGFAEDSIDYSMFWINFGATPSTDTVSSNLIDARDSFANYAKFLFDYAFDGDISSSDVVLLNLKIETAKTETERLWETLRTVCSKSEFIYKNNGYGQGKSTAVSMIHSLAPLLNITYTDIAIDLENEPSYLTGLINVLTDFALLSPPTPTTPDATDGTYTDKVQISWDNVSSATTYKIYRCTNTLTSSCSYLSSDSSSPYDDTEGTAGTTYYYRITASNSAGDSDYSNYNTGYKAFSPDPYEPNNSYQSPSNLGEIVGENDIYGLEISPRDVDYYKFEIVATGTQDDYVKIYIQNDAYSGSDSYDLDLAIGKLNSSGDLVPAVGSWYNSMSLTDGRTETISLEGYGPGVYYVIVFGASGYDLGEDNPTFIGTEASGYILDIHGPIPKVATPTISPNGGTFIGSAQITLFCSTSDAEIRYTTDGTTPTNSSTPYNNNSFTIDSPSTVKARGFKSDYTESDVVVRDFTKFLGDINADGAVDLVDVILSLQILTQTNLQSKITLTGDVNYDMNIGIAEAMYAMQVAGGVIPEQPLPLGIVASAGQLWMDRNLGATRVATSPTDSAAYGDYYQWGRATDGHEKINSTTTTFVLDHCTSTGKYFVINGENFSHEPDWAYYYCDDLWQGVTGVHNPCPPGFRLPTKTELEIELNSWNGDTPDPAFTSPLKLVYAGYRSYYDGSHRDADVVGEIWSSTLDWVPWLLHIQQNWGKGIMTQDMRTFGFSVRCIKD